MTRGAVRVLKAAAATVAVLLMLAALGLFLLISWKPPAYAPSRLSENQKHRMAGKFLARVVKGFVDGAKSGRPFSLSFSQDDLNAYLASMDHIASLRPSVRHGDVYKVMDQVGLAEPAVRLDDGVLTAMVRSRDHEKIISAGLTFTFLDNAGLKVDLAGAYIGRAPVPRALVRHRLKPVKAILRKQAEKLEASSKPTRPRGLIFVGFSTRDIGRIIRSTITAIDEEPIPPADLISKTGGARVRVTAIDVRNGNITLHFVPVPREKESES